MKKVILSLTAALCVFIVLSSETLISTKSDAVHSFSTKLNSKANLAPGTLTAVTYRNLKPDAGFVEINDLTTGQTYSASLPPTTGPGVGSTGISLPIGDNLAVTVFSGNGNCSITCNGSTQAGVSSMSITALFMPNPSWIVIQ